MRKFLLLLCVATLCCACIDDAYDLDKLEEPEIVIGNDESEFTLPLAHVTVCADELQENGVELQSIIDEIDIWLPSELPNGADYVDIELLASSSDYLNSLIDALFEEMADPTSGKMDQIIDLLWNNETYRNYFALLPAETEELFRLAFIELFSQDNILGDTLRDQVAEIAQAFLQSIRVEPICYDAELGLGEELIDLLVANVDPRETPHPVHTLFIYGEIVSEFPMSFRLEATFGNDPLALSVTPFEVKPNTKTAIPDTQFYGEELRALLNHFSIEVTFTPMHYFPNVEITPEQKVLMSLNLRKTGGVKFN